MFPSSIHARVHTHARTHIERNIKHSHVGKHVPCSFPASLGLCRPVVLLMKSLICACVPARGSSSPFPVVHSTVRTHLTPSPIPQKRGTCRSGSGRSVRPSSRPNFYLPHPRPSPHTHTHTHTYFPLHLSVLFPLGVQNYKKYISNSKKNTQKKQQQQQSVNYVFEGCASDGSLDTFSASVDAGVSNG